MAFIDKRKQNVVYWPSVLADGYPVAGPLGESYQLIKARWEDLHEKFIDLEGRDDVSRSVIYTKPQLNLGAFVKLVDSASDPQIAPQYTQEYPPLVPYTLLAFLEYWNFNDVLTGEKGNDFSITAGSAGYSIGVVSKSISTDGDTGYTLDSQSDLSIDGDTEFTMSFWIKSDAESLDTCTIDMLIANSLACSIEIGSTDLIDWGNADLSNSSQFSPVVGWASSFTSVILTWKKGETQDIYIDGISQTLDSQTIYNTALVENSLSVTTTAIDCDIELDELRVYPSVLSQKDIQMIAAIHPSQYKEAYEVRQTAMSTNLRGNKRIYKQWLKSKE